jgi:autotransporter-associated beta strand protein
LVVPERLPRALAGPLVIGGGFSEQHEVRWQDNSQLTPGVPVTVHTNGLLALNGFTETISDLTLSGGRVTLGNFGTLRASGAITVLGTNRTASIEGAPTTGAMQLIGTVTCDVGDGSAVGPDLLVTARLTSSGAGITKNGGGTLALAGDNTYSGHTRVNDGILRVDHNNALGSTQGASTVADGATLYLANAASLVRERVNLNGVGYGGTNGALLASGAVTLSNDVILASASTVRVDSPWHLRIDGSSAAPAR